MRNFKSIGGSAVFLTLMTTTASFADVTADQVWSDWKEYMTNFGYELSATEKQSGDALTVSDIAMTMELPEGEGSIALTMGEMTFTDRGDGTVAVTIPPVMPFTMQVDATDNEDLDLAMQYTNTGLSMIVSGTPEDMLYSYSAAELAIELVEMKVDDQVIDSAKVNVVLGNMIGSSTMKVGDIRSAMQNFAASTVTYDLGLTDPEGSGSFAMKGQLADLKFTGGTSIPTEFDPENMANALTAGFAVDGEFTYGGGNSEFSFADGRETMSGSSSSTAGSLTVAMDENALNYGGAAEGMKMSIMGSEIPFPINVEMAESAFNLLMPVSKSDEPQDFALLTKMVDLSVEDMIWGLVDPTGALPHDPATVVLDLSGKANWLFNIMDPEAAEAMAGDTPGQLHALTLNELQVKIAGADLTGSGDFTFDNTDLQTFDGMPKPTGAIDLKLVGGNGLLDNLVAMGLVPEDQAMGVRMMMGLFARPGDGDDTLVSKIEVTEDGAVLANGQRLQ